MQITLDIENSLLAAVQAVARREQATVGEVLCRLAKSGLQHANLQEELDSAQSATSPVSPSGYADFELLPCDHPVNPQDR
ncbi:MAG: hypothetical protein ACRYGK_13565 [Janthinobacterium lividum]